MKKPDNTWENYTADLTYTADGRLASETINGGTTTAITYDAAGQIDTQTGPGAVNYDYDDRGIRTQMVIGADTTSYTANSDGSIATATTGSEVVTYAYDDAGRRTTETTKVSGSTTRTVTTSYDARGKPDTVTDIAGATTKTEERTYDGTSQLVKIEVDDGVWDLSHELVWDTTQAVPQVLEGRINGFLWIRVDWGNERLAYKAGFFPTWYKLDSRNSVINPDNNTNVAAGPTAYDPYGTPTDAGYFAFGYRGEYHIGNIIHLRNRDYDPHTGQFTTPDPLDGVDGTTAVSNPYHYTENDPYNRVDPLGRRSQDDAHGGVVAREIQFKVPILPGGGRFRMGHFIKERRVRLAVDIGEGDGRSFRSQMSDSDNRIFWEMNFETGRGRLFYNYSCDASGECFSALSPAKTSTITKGSQGVTIAYSVGNSVAQSQLDDCTGNGLNCLAFEPTVLPKISASISVRPEGIAGCVSGDHSRFPSAEIYWDSNGQTYTVRRWNQASGSAAALLLPNVHFGCESTGVGLAPFPSGGTPGNCRPPRCV